MKLKLFCLTIATLLTTNPFLHADTVDNRLKEIEADFRKAHDAKVEAPFRKKLGNLRKNYKVALNRKKLEASRDRNLQGAMLFQTEIDNLAKDLDVPETDPPGTNEAVREMRDTYRNFLSKLEAERNQNSLPLYTAWDGLLEQYQDELTQSLKLQDAKKVAKRREEIKAIAGNLQAAPPSSAISGTNSSTGRLVIKGKVNGQPFRVPDNLKDMEFQWIKARQNGAFAGATDGKVYFIDQRGAKLQKYSRVLDFVDKDNPWKGTELRDNGSLRWQFQQSKEDGTIRNVTKFFVGGQAGKGAYHSLLALKSDGSLDILTFGNIRMKWNFHTWQNSRKFKDIAMCGWKGMGGVALAVTTDGDLHAFNAEGFYELPPEMKTNVHSVSSGGGGMRYQVVMKNGDVYGWTRGLQKDFPLDNLLMVWDKTTPEKFGGKIPVKIHQRYNWKTIQFTDGTWEIWEGLSGVRDRNSNPEIDNVPFQDLQREKHEDKGTNYIIGLQ